MTVADLIAAAFWPVTGSLFLVAWAFRRNRTIFEISLVVASIIVIAGITALIIFDITSLWVLLDLYIGAIFFGVLCLFALYVIWSKGSRWARLVLGFAGLASLGGGTYHFIADYVMARQIVQGTVQLLHVFWHSKGANEHVVKINDQFYAVTTQMYETLRVGDSVRAEIGRGSGYIYRIEREPRH